MDRRKPNTLVEIIALIFIILGSLTLSVFYVTTWAHSLIFDTNAYLEVVTPLPREPEVAKALSNYTIDRLFQNINVEERIRSALPEQAQFIASTLADELQTRSYHRTEQIIQSDQFSSLWIAANTVFHQRIIEIVRSGGILPDLQARATSQDKNIPFDASQLAQTIKNQLGSDNALFTDAQINEFRSIAIPAYARLEHIRQIVYWISQLKIMSLSVAFALILSGIAISWSRQKALVTTGILVSITMLITLLSLQIIKTDFLSQVTNTTYNQAATVVWDSFVANLKQSLRFTFVGGLILIGLALVAGAYKWSRELRKSLGLPQLQKSGFMSGVTSFRIALSGYGIWLRLLGVGILVTVLFTTTTVTLATVVIGFSLLLIYLALLTFIFPRQS